VVWRAVERLGVTPEAALGETDTLKRSELYAEQADVFESRLSDGTSAAKAYRVYFRKVPGADGNYTMDHTGLVYLMDKQGNFVAPFNLKRRPEEAAADLRKYL